MPRFYLHVAGLEPTEEDAEHYRDKRAAHAGAIESARELLSEGALSGLDRIDWQMVVKDSAGEIISVLPFSDTLRKQAPK